MPEDGYLRNIAKRVYSKLFPDKSIDIMIPVLTSAKQKALNDAIRIGFVGDLILLRDMVEMGVKDGKYVFSPMFEYIQPYFSQCDFM